MDADWRSTGTCIIRVGANILKSGVIRFYFSFCQPETPSTSGTTPVVAVIAWRRPLGGTAGWGSTWWDQHKMPQICNLFWIGTDLMYIMIFNELVRAIKYIMNSHRCI